MAKIRPHVEDVLTQGGTSVQNVNTNVNFVVGKSYRGPDEEIFVGSPETIYRRFGGGDLVNFIKRASLNGGQHFKVVRVVGSGAAKASLTVQNDTTDVGTFQAKDKGAYGNSLKVKIVAGGISSTITIWVEYKGYTLGAAENCSTGNDIQEKIADNSQLSNFIQYTPITQALPDNQDYTSLATGSDGAEVTNTEIVGSYNSTTGARTGLQLSVVDNEWHNIATATLEGDATINAALHTVCKSRGDIGKGKAIVTCLGSAAISDIKTAVNALISSDFRLTFWAGWYKSIVDPDNYVSPVAAVMGIISKMPVFESCSNIKIEDAIEVKSKYDGDQIDELLGVKCNVVTNAVDDGLPGIKTHHSFLCTTDTRLTEVQHVSVLDYINQKMRSAILPYVSRPNRTKSGTIRLRDVLMGIGTNIKYNVLNESTPWGPGVVDDMYVQCDDVNNPPELQSNTLLFDWGAKFIGAAHYIKNRITVTDGELFVSTLDEVIQ